MQCCRASWVYITACKVWDSEVWSSKDTRSQAIELSSTLAIERIPILAPMNHWWTNDVWFMSLSSGVEGKKKYWHSPKRSYTQVAISPNNLCILCPLLIHLQRLYISLIQAHQHVKIPSFCLWPEVYATLQWGEIRASDQLRLSQNTKFGAIQLRVYQGWEPNVRVWVERSPKHDGGFIRLVGNEGGPAAYGVLIVHAFYGPT